MTTSARFAAATRAWDALPGADLAFAIDTLGDGSRAISTMILIAKHRYDSDAYAVLRALYWLVAPDKHDGVQEWRAGVDKLDPSRLELFDKYARLAAEHLLIHNAWIEMEMQSANDELKEILKELT